MLAEMFGMEWCATRYTTRPERLEACMQYLRISRQNYWPNWARRRSVRMAISVNWKAQAAAAGADCFCLAHAEAGGSYRVERAFTSATAGCSSSLNNAASRPGAQLRVSGRNYDQTLTLATDAGTVCLGASAAEKVWFLPAADRRSRQ